MHKVFVYGSLKSGFGNHRLLEDSTFITEDTTKEKEFNMFSFGGFPGIVKGGDDAIRGELYEVDDNTMNDLDRLESNGYFYQREVVSLDSGEQAWMYITLGDRENSLDDKRRVLTSDGVSNWENVR